MHVVRTDDAWSVWHPDDKARRSRMDGTVDRWASKWDDTSSGRLTGTLKSSVLKAVQKHLKHF
jgi:hypothetical protein